MRSISFMQTSRVAIYTKSQLFLSYCLQASCKYLTFYICDSQQHLSYRLSWASLIVVPFYHQPWFGMTLFLTHLRMQFLCLNLALIRYVEFFRFLDFLLNNLHFVSSYISLIYSLFFLTSPFFILLYKLIEFTKARLCNVWDLTVDALLCFCNIWYNKNGHLQNCPCFEVQFHVCPCFFNSDIIKSLFTLPAFDTFRSSQ